MFKKYYYRSLIMLSDMFLTKLSPAKKVYYELEADNYIYTQKIQIDVRGAILNLAVFIHKHRDYAIIINPTMPRKCYFKFITNIHELVTYVKSTKKIPDDWYMIDLTDGIDFTKTIWRYLFNNTNF